jgi:hypothetical protein
VFGEGDGGDAGRAALEELPGPPGWVYGPVGWGDDAVAAFAAGFGEDFDGRLPGGRVGGAGAAGEFLIAGGGCVADAVEEVHAAGGGLFEVAGHEGAPQFAEPGGEGGFAGLCEQVVADGAAFPFDHDEPAGDGAADDAKPGMAGLIPEADLVFVGRLLLIFLPGAEGALRFVGHGWHDRAAGGVERERRVEHQV